MRLSAIFTVVCLSRSFASKRCLWNDYTDYSRHLERTLASLTPIPEAAKGLASLG